MRGAPVAMCGTGPAILLSAPRSPNGHCCMSEQEQADIRLEYARLKQEHIDFDSAINAMIATGCDPLQIQRMKKKKLAIKDRMSKLEDSIIPDIIA